MENSHANAEELTANSSWHFWGKAGRGSLAHLTSPSHPTLHSVPSTCFVLFGLRSSMNTLSIAETSGERGLGVRADRVIELCCTVGRHQRMYISGSHQLAAIHYDSGPCSASHSMSSDRASNCHEPWLALMHNAVPAGTCSVISTPGSRELFPTYQPCGLSPCGFSLEYSPHIFGTSKMGGFQELETVSLGDAGVNAHQQHRAARASNRDSAMKE